MNCNSCPWWKRRPHDVSEWRRTWRCTAVYVPHWTKPGVVIVNPHFNSELVREGCSQFKAQKTTAQV